MSIVQAIRLSNRLESGAVDATALETLMADPVQKGEFSGLMTLRGQARRMADNVVSATAIVGSTTANAALQETRAGAEEFASSPVAAPILSANRTAMRTVTGSSAGARRWLSQFPYAQRDIKMASPTGAAYGAGVYVAVNNAGLISSSPDAVTWTLRTNPLGSPVGFADVAYAFGLFVAVDVSGRVITSPDGTTWTQRTQATAGTVNNTCKIVVADGKVAFGLNATTVNLPVIVFSADGITWERTVAASGGGINPVYFLAFTGKLWVVGTANQATTNYNIWTTPAGITTASVLTGVALVSGAPAVSGFFVNGWLYVSINSVIYRFNDSLGAQKNYTLAELDQVLYGVIALPGMLLASGSTAGYKVSYDNGISFFNAVIPTTNLGNSGALRLLNNTIFFVTGTTLSTNF